MVEREAGIFFPPDECRFSETARVLLFPAVLKQPPGHWLPFFVFSDTKEHVNCHACYTQTYMKAKHS